MQKCRQLESGTGRADAYTDDFTQVVIEALVAAPADRVVCQPSPFCHCPEMAQGLLAFLGLFSLAQAANLNFVFSFGSAASDQPSLPAFRM